MTRNFEIRIGIHLIQPPHELNLHDNFDFQDLHYSVATRTLCLTWHRSPREGVPTSLPSRVTIEFRSVSEFRFHPRDPHVPFTEDDCVSHFGYWCDEAWADGAMVCDSDPDPSWLTAIEYMSGAILAVQSDSAHAVIAD